MPLQYADRVKETTTTTGTGAYTLGGAVVGFQSFAAVGDGNTCEYAVTDGTEWETGLGTYSAPGSPSEPTLARTTIYSSSNDNNAVNWGAGSKEIFLTLPASRVSLLGTVTSITVTGANGIGVSGSPITSSGTIGLSLGDITPTSVNTAYVGSTLTNPASTGLFIQGAANQTRNLSEWYSSGGALLASISDYGVLQTGSIPGLLGAASGSYPFVGYNVVPSQSVANTYTYKTTDTAYIIQIGSDGVGGNTCISFQYAESGTAGNPVTFTIAQKIWGTTGFTHLGTSPSNSIAKARLHVSQSQNGKTTLGAAPSLILDNTNGGNGELQEIGFGYSGASSITYQPVVIGHRVTANANLTKGDFYIATRDVETDTAPIERVTVTASGIVSINNKTAITLGNLNQLQVAGTTSATNSLGISAWSADALGSRIELGKSRGAAIGTNTIVQNNDVVASVTGYGANGSTFTNLASISMEVDGTPGATTDMPGRIVFSTVPDGSGTLTEAMRLSQDQSALFANTIKTAAPTTGTAAPWKLGTLVTGQVGLVMLTTQYVEVDISGTLCRLATV